MNCLVPLCPSPYLMLVCWCINGLAQAFMWPPLIKLITANFEGLAYENAVTKVSTISGILNSCTYIGSAASTYGIALISEKAGWNFTLLIWFIIALTGTAICFAAARPWTKKMGE